MLLASNELRVQQLAVTKPARKHLSEVGQNREIKRIVSKLTAQSWHTGTCSMQTPNPLELEFFLVWIQSDGRRAPVFDRKRLTNTPVRAIVPVLKCPNDRKNRVVSAPATYTSGSPAVGG